MRVRLFPVLLVATFCVTGLSSLATEPAAAVVNGQRTAPPPWMALIITNDFAVHEGPLCSGVLVGDGWVLTAAHCVGHGSTQPNQIRVILGRTRRNDSSQGRAYGVARIVVAPGGVDAALIFLTGFDSDLWHAMPLAVDASADSAGAVNIYGYGDYGWSSLGTPAGVGLLNRSPDGAFRR